MLTFILGGKFLKSIDRLSSMILFVTKYLKSINSPLINYWMSMIALKWALNVVINLIFYEGSSEFCFSFLHVRLLKNIFVILLKCLIFNKFWKRLVEGSGMCLLFAFRMFTCASIVLETCHIIIDFSQYLDTRGQKGQSASEIVSDDGVMFFTLINQNAIGCWNSLNPYQSDCLDVVAQDNEALIYPSDIRVSNMIIQKIFIIIIQPNFFTTALQRWHLDIV